ncbi:MAG: methionine--tRNA ligase [bacterium]
MNRNKFYITTPIYYVNSKPHLGTLYSTLLADIFARWNKVMGKNVFFLTGTDEHGQKLQEAAEKAGLPPKQFVDSVVPEFKKTWANYEIEYNKFIRTTDEEHKKAVKCFIEKLQEQGDIYKSSYTGMYCVPCETFVTINTETPKDSAGNHVCPSCQRGLKEVSEESYFFRLSAYQDQLLKFYEENPNFVAPKERLQEVISFVKSGLKDLSISRKNVSWGIPFPGDPAHTVYVWGDALLNYLSAIGYGQNDIKSEEDFKFWWPADVQVMAKDIVRFHAVYWPAFLMALNLPQPKKLLVHGFILMGDYKMSKSRGNIIDPDNLANWYGIEQVRYYLARHISVAQDSQFDLKDLENYITADLANGVGNLLSRTLTLALNNNFSVVTAPAVFDPSSISVKEKAEEAFRIYWEEMNNLHPHIALAELWKFVAHVNAYFHTMQPWVLAKQNRELFEEVIYVACKSMYKIAVLLWPVMPNKMETLLKHLGHDFNVANNYEKEFRDNKVNKTFNLIAVKEPLFVRPESHIEQVKQELAQGQNVSGASLTGDGSTSSPRARLLDGARPELVEGCEGQNGANKQAKPAEAKSCETEIININDFAKVQLLVGTVKTCQPVSGSDKLLKLEVDLGAHGVRQILSGVAQWFKPEDLAGKQGIFVANLAPRKMLGQESQGMMLFAKDEVGNMRMITVGGFVENGTRVS